MAHPSALPLMLTIGVVWIATAIGCASQAAPPLSATIVSVQGASTTSHPRDWHGKWVTVRVPSPSSAAIQGMEPQGSGRATVTAIDPTTHQGQVRLLPTSLLDIEAMIR